MAIRNIAHAIQSGETLLGLAVGVESMSLQCVVFFSITAVSPILAASPRPTPIVVESIASHSQAHDCTEVRGTTLPLVP